MIRSCDMDHDKQIGGIFSILSYINCWIRFFSDLFNRSWLSYYFSHIGKIDNVYQNPYYCSHPNLMGMEEFWAPNSYGAFQSYSD